jgi:hypothetical protein
MPLEAIAMTNRELLLQELQSIPDPIIDRVLVFVRQLQINAASPAAPAADGPFDPTALPIWQLAAKATALVPDEDWQNVPTDLAKNFDVYQQQEAD